MRHSEALRDLAIIAVISAILLAGSAHLDLTARLLTSYGHAVIGPVLSIVVVSSMALAFAAMRMWRAAHNEMQCQRRIEGQVREAEQRFAAFFSHCPNALFAAHADSGVIVDVNEEMERLLGMPRPHLIGRETHAVGLWSTAEEGARLRRIVREEGGLRNVETVVSTVHGATRAVLLSAELIDDGQGKLLLGSLTDISDRRAREDRHEQQAFCDTLAALMDGHPRPDRRRAPAFRALRTSRYIQSR